MSATPWMVASQVMRSRCGARTSSVSGVRPRVLDPRVGECLGDPPVQLGVGGLVDDRPLVEALEVERVDGARGDQRGDQARRPSPSPGRA